MQTHKNPGLRSGPAPYKAPSSISNGSATKAVAAPAAKPPTFVRDGKKWLIEYQKGNTGLLVEDAEMNNVVSGDAVRSSRTIFLRVILLLPQVYMFRCENSTLQIKGKINSVVMDSCKKCSLVFDSLVASAEFVNCQSVQMQVSGGRVSSRQVQDCNHFLFIFGTGPRQGSHHLHRQDGRLPDVSVGGLARSGDRQLQVVRDERDDPEGHER